MIKILNKINYFFKLDIRKKLKIISRISKINVYPRYLPKSGIKSIYTRILINLFLLAEFKKYKRILNKKIFFNKKKVFKTNFLISTPSSGSTFLRLMLQSYFELFHKVGNGIPKYDNINNRMIFSASQIQSADLWNEIKIHNALIESSKFIDDEKFEKLKFVMSRYPLGEMNLYKLNEIKPAVIFRDPYEVILSTYLKQDRRNTDERDKIVNNDILNKRIKACEKYIFFWNNYFETREHNKDFLVVDYNKLISETNEVLKKVLEFYNYEIEDEYVQISTNLHSSKNSLDFFKNLKIYNRTRFTDPELKKKQQKIVYPALDNALKNNDLISTYNSIIQKYNI